jgi:hypothetical protein
MSQLNATLYGKILRIDVNSREYSNAYGIPADNPYASGVNALPQIYANGIRNPWGLSFDAKGHLWCADVGQDIWEEINWITNGGNYGWQFREGPVPFALNTDTPPADAKFIEPIHSYNHAEGLSITGGIVYTGKSLPELTGAYVYGDFVLGKVWALKTDDAGKVLSNDLLYTSPQTPADNPKKKPTVLVKPTAFCANAAGDCSSSTGTESSTSWESSRVSGDPRFPFQIIPPLWHSWTACDASRHPPSSPLPHHALDMRLRGQGGLGRWPACTRRSLRRVLRARRRLPPL